MVDSNFLGETEIFALLQASPAWTWIIVHHLRDQEARFWHGEDIPLIARVLAFGEDALPGPDRHEHSNGDSASAASGGGATEIPFADES